MQTSSRFGVSYPSPARTDPADPAIHIGNVVTGLEKAVRHEIGTFALRPISSVGTPGIAGRLYYSTDEGQLYYDYGTGWISVYATNVPLLRTVNTAAGNPSYQTFVGADAYPRLQVRADGTVSWGPGNVAGDTTLSRSSANVLQTGGTFTAVGDLVPRVGAANEQVTVGRAGPGNEAGMKLGSANDTALYRAAAGLLRTDGDLFIGGHILVQNQNLNPVGGAQYAKLPLYDANNALLGYVPIYSA